MAAGRPRQVQPESLYAFAQEFYGEFRRIAGGTVRWRFDAHKYEEAITGLDEIPLIDDEDRKRHKQLVEEEIRSGRVEKSGREAWLRDIENAELSVRREMYRREAGQMARKELKILGQPDVINELLEAETPERVCEICKGSVTSRRIEVEPGSFKVVSGFPNWPLHAGSTLPWYLSQFAEEFVDAKRDPRYPRSSRPTNRLKQLWFLSRALAGAVYGVKTRTAINLVGSMRPEQVFEESRAATPKRRRRKINCEY